MKIYESEIKDGIAELVKANASIAYLSKINKAPNPAPITIDLEKTATKANANPNQMDLYYLDSVLVNTGWNLNDDFFEPTEVWAARTSPVDKQINLMHNEKDIIGHMTSSSVLVDGELYQDDEIPDDFQIKVGGVLYRVWNDEKLKERMDTLIDEIEDDKWCVSMECIFANFDYVIRDKDGTESIIKRNKTTAYLTKHLKIYGGKGEFEGKRIGRVLRRITFSGKGIVDEPANPESIIFNDKAKANVQESKMTEEVMKAQAEALNKQIAELQAANKSLAEEVKAKAEKENKAQLDELNKVIAEQKTMIEMSKAELEAKTKSLEESAELVKASQAKIEETQQEIVTLKASIKKAERLAQLTKAGVEIDKQESLLVKFENVSDDIFSEFVALHAAKQDKEDMKEGDDSKEDPKDKKDDKESKKEDKKEEKEEAKASIKALEDAELTDKTHASAGVESESEATENTRKQTISWLGSVFNTKATRGFYNIRNTQEVNK